MKLRTKMQAWRDGKTIPVAPDTSKSFFMMEHDAAAAHALMQAVKEWRESPDAGQMGYDAVTEIEQRADELMREWGFDE